MSSEQVLEFKRKIEELEKLVEQAEKWKEKYDMLEEKFKELENENERLKKSLNEANENVEQLRNEINKKNEELEEYRKGLGGVRRFLFGEEKGRISLNLEARELNVKVVHKEEVKELSTTTGLGKIMYVMLEDFKDKPVTEKEISDALNERGWWMAHSTLAPNLSQLVTQGFLLKILDAKPYQYRLPKKVKINLVG